MITFTRNYMYLYTYIYIYLVHIDLVHILVYTWLLCKIYHLINSPPNIFWWPCLHLPTWSWGSMVAAYSSG